MILHKDKAEESRSFQGNIILVGNTGSGKSSVGRQLAARMGYGFLDIDQWIEKSEKSSVSSIFLKKGESYFRSKESEVLATISQINSHVIATGAGIQKDEGNTKLIQSLGTTIWLNVPTQIIVKRLLRDADELKKRPLLSDLEDNDNPGEREQVLIEKLEKQLQQREASYRLADIVFSDRYASCEDASRCILKELLLSSPSKKRRAINSIGDEAQTKFNDSRGEPDQISNWGNNNPQLGYRDD